MPPIINLTGQRFGRLVAIKITPERQGGRVVWECKCDCGETTLVTTEHLRSGHTRSCGCSRRGSGNGRWNGGKQMVNGYVSRLVPEHPGSSRGYVLEHRLVMEKHLGRLLKPQEVVHHINGDKTDNRAENLLIFKNESEHQQHHQQLIHSDKPYSRPRRRVGFAGVTIGIE